MTTLATYSALARALTEDGTLYSRIDRCLALIQQAQPQLQIRLTVWPHGPERPPQHWATPGAVEEGWDGGRAVQIARRRQPLVLDRHATPALPPLPFTAPPSQPGPASLPADMSYMGFPVLWEGRLWGVLEARRAGTFDAGERAMLAGLLPLLAAAIADDQWGRIESAAPGLSPEHYRVLSTVGRDLEAPLALPSLLALVLRWALDTTNASAGAINLVNRERGEYSLAVAEGYDSPGQPGSPALATGRQTWPWNIGAVGRVARTGKAALLTDVAHDPEFLAARPDIRAELVVPVRVDGATLAVLVLDTTTQPGFNSPDLYFVQALADAAARPLQRALVYQELLDARTQLQQTLASLPLGLALIEPDGRVLRTNQAWYTLWNVAPPPDSAALYLPWDLLPGLLKRLSHPLELTDFFADGQKRVTETLEMTIRLLNPPQDLSLRSLPVLDAQDLHSGRLVMVEDITREREIDKMKNEFVSVVSHELRTPLTSILGYTELLLARDFSKVERQEFTQTVYDQADQLSKMVDDLLSLSRLDAGQVKLNRWVVSLHQIIREITKQLNESLSDRHRLLIDIPDTIPPIFVDKDKIRQVLTNMLSNAIKYSPAGGQIGLIVRELRQPPPGAPPLPPERALLIAIRDQGMGIAPEDLPSIFERFFRVDNSMTRKIGGTGLGLSITRALVELHGGRIWATSELGKGTTFWLTLPIATELARRS